jgi:hypothetical protein
METIISEGGRNITSSRRATKDRNWRPVQIVMKEHKALTAPNCRTGNLLSDSSIEKGLKLLSVCQEATGVERYTKKIDDGHHKLFLEL